MINQFQKSKIIIATPLYPPKQGGASIYFSTLAKFLRQKLNVLILTTTHKGEPVISKDGDITIFRIIPTLLFGPKIGRYFVLPLISFFLIFLLWFYYKPKIIHVHSATGVAFGVGLFSLIFRVPIVKDIRDNQTITFNLKLGKLKKYIVCSKSIKERLLSAGIQEEKIAFFPVINSPIVKQIAEKVKKEKKSEVTLLFVGELSEMKGINVLLGAFKMVTEKSNSINLKIIGDGFERRNCEKFLRSNKIDGRVGLLGNMEYKKTLEEIAKSDILVLPSRSEGQPRVLLEAFEFEKAVIATNVGGIQEIVKDGVNGILVEYGDVEGLAKEILELSLNKELRERLGKNSKKFLKMLPLWDQITTKMVNMYYKDEKGAKVRRRDKN